MSTSLHPSVFNKHFYSLFPFASVGLGFEENYSFEWGHKFFEYTWPAALTTSLLYVVLVHAGQKWMKDRPAWGLTTPLKYWNLCLALYSLYGAIRVVPYALYLLTAHDMTTLTCTPGEASFGEGVIGFVCWTFAVSKVFELIDTLFLVLRKKPVSFLHWFHHFTVLAYCWHAMSTKAHIGIFYMAMNLVVHTIMYGYYYLAAIGKPPAWGRHVTTIQILQMLAGSYLAFTGISLRLTLGPLSDSFKMTNTNLTRVVFEKHGCGQDFSNALGAAFIYSCYLVLFSNFFLRRYIIGSNRSSNKQVAPNSASSSSENTEGKESSPMEFSQIRARK